MRILLEHPAGKVIPHRMEQPLVQQQDQVELAARVELAVA
jgi:hypothetical protein